MTGWLLDIPAGTLLADRFRVLELRGAGTETACCFCEDTSLFDQLVAVRIAFELSERDAFKQQHRLLQQARIDALPIAWAYAEHGKERRPCVATQAFRAPNMREWAKACPRSLRERVAVNGRVN